MSRIALIAAAVVRVVLATTLLGLPLATASSTPAAAAEPRPECRGLDVSDGKKSQNGWPASHPGSDIGVATYRTRAGIPVSVRKGDVATILMYVTQRFEREVEPLRAGQVGGYNCRYIGGTRVFSNHSSGTAVDLNWTRHPLAKRGTFTAEQQRAIRAIMRVTGPVVRWGGDYRTTADEMHFEIDLPPGHPAIRSLAAKLRGTTAPPPPRQPYTATEVCGPGFTVIDRSPLGDAGTVYLLWNGRTSQNCVVTMKGAGAGTRGPTGAYLQPDGVDRIVNQGAYQYYAGPVVARAPGCVRWGGSVGDQRYESPREHCG